MRNLTFILLWIGIIVVISLLNYRPTKKVKKIIVEDDYEYEEEKERKVVVKPPYIYLLFGIVFLPIATVFISSIIINKALIAPYILLITKGIKTFINTYEIVTYIIIFEIVILFSALFFRNIGMNRFIKSLVRFAVSISLILFLLALLIHLL